MARPTKCTPETIERFCAVIREGGNATKACRAAGIHISTYCDWQNMHGPAFTRFRRALKSAKAAAWREHSRKWMAIFARL